MRFALKICICTVLIVALLFGVLGQILIAQSFQTALRFRVQAAVADYSALASALEAELYGIYLYYSNASPAMYAEILRRAGSNQGVESPCALYDTDFTLLTASNEAFPETLDFSELRVRRFAYRLIRADNGRTLLDTAGCVSIGGQNYFLSVRYDATDLMQLRNEQIESVTLLHVIAVALSTAAMLLISYLTTKPLRRLQRFTTVIGRMTSRYLPRTYTSRRQSSAIPHIKLTIELCT